MGWFRDDPAHEGFLVALEPAESNAGGSPRLRELRAPDDEAERPIRLFKVGCECGWRSRTFRAPPRARWFPYSLELHDEDLRDECARVWGEHYDAEQGRPGGRLVPAPDQA
jgi:hypothetical protein